MKKAYKILPHATIVMAGMMIVFFLIDRVNTPMGFMVNEFHKWLSFLLAIACVGYSVQQISFVRKRERAEENRRIRERQARRSAAQRPAQSAAAPKRPVQGRPAVPKGYNIKG